MKKTLLASLILLFLLPSFRSAGQELTAEKKLDYVFESGTGAYNTFRIPALITTSVKLSNWTWYATGPCHGIQVANGQYKDRLIIPCDHIEAVTGKYYSHVIYSDNNGKTWNLGGTTPQDQVNECTIAELSGGKLILNTGELGCLYEAGFESPYEGIVFQKISLK